MPKGFRYYLENGMKYCGCCNSEKSISEFYIYKKSGKLKSPCKKCCNERTERWRKANLARAAATMRKHRQNDPHRFRQYQLKCTYGLEYGEFDRRLSAQGGGCAICGEKNPTKGRGGLHVDHCKKSGKIRGILCHNCNIGIGNLQHDPDIIRAALKYLLDQS